MTLGSGSHLNKRKTKEVPQNNFLDGDPTRGIQSLPRNKFLEDPSVMEEGDNRYSVLNSSENKNSVKTEIIIDDKKKKEIDEKIKKGDKKYLVEDPTKTKNKNFVNRMKTV